MTGLLAEALLGRFSLDAFLLGTGVEEAPFRRGEVGVGSSPPFERLGEATTAVELAVGSAHRVPGVGGDGEVAEDALALDIVVQPGLQPGPGPGQRFVGQLDGVVVAGHQPGVDEQLDELVVLGVGGDGAAGDAAAHWFALGGRGRPGAAAGRAAAAAGSAGTRL